MAEPLQLTQSEHQYNFALAVKTGYCVDYNGEVVMDIATWLRDLGLERYISTFHDNDIDQEVLPDLNDSDLEKLGITLGHRKKLLKAIGELSSSRDSRDTGNKGVVALEGERRRLTVMFCDLVGSTALAERLDPETLRDVIIDYQNICAGVVTRFDGYIAKYMGDGILVYFGFPATHEDEADRAVRAALGIVDAMGRAKTAALGQLHVRIGIATGRVVVGNVIGVGAAQEYAVMGEAPNLAARLQALADPNAVIIAAETKKAIGNAFVFEHLGQQSLKGFSRPVEAWRVLAQRPVQSRFEAFQVSNISPLIGRDHELSLLLDRWADAKNGEGQVVLLSGEPGIGKSRLAQALRSKTANEPQIRLRYQCSSYHINSALHPIIAQTEFAAGIKPDDSPEQKLTKLEVLLAGSSKRLVVPLLASMISIPTGDRYTPLDMPATVQKQKTFDALLAHVSELAARKPLLMILEDVHWIDPTTSELFGFIIEHVQNLPVLLVITFRPEFVPPWGHHSHFTSLALNRLSRQHCTALVETITSGKSLPQQVLSQIVQKTDGVPLFVEELTKALLESGALKSDADQYSLSSPIPPMAIPDTLQDSLMARLDRLAATKDIAQIASVIGREFSYEVLAAVSGLSDIELQAALDRLVGSGLVFRRGASPNSGYSFKHALVGDAAYESLLHSRRRQLHARIAQIFQSQFPLTAENEPEILAHHYTEATIPREAAIYWLRAGERALQRSTYVEAVAHLTKGLEVQQKLPADEERASQELAYQAAMGNAFLALKGYGARETGRAFTRARELCDQVSGAPQRYSVLYGEWAYHLTNARFRVAREQAERLLEEGRSRQDSNAIVVGHRISGFTAHLMGDFAAAKCHFENHLAVYDPSLHRSLAFAFGQDPRVSCLANYACLKCITGESDEGLAMSRQAIAYAQELNHANTRAYAECFALQVQQFCGQVAAIETEALPLIAFFEDKRLAMWSAWASIILAWSRGQHEKFTEAIDEIEEKLKLLRESGQVLLFPYFYTLLAETLARAGRLEAALRSISEAAALIDSTEERWWEAEVYRMKGELLKASGKHTEEVEAAFDRALEIARRQGAKTIEQRASRSLDALSDTNRKSELLSVG
jgi:predicted ATPase/class 3 adenylate cyclase